MNAKFSDLVDGRETKDPETHDTSPEQTENCTNCPNVKKYGFKGTVLVKERK